MVQNPGRIFLRGLFGSYPCLNQNCLTISAKTNRNWQLWIGICSKTERAACLQEIVGFRWCLDKGLESLWIYVPFIQGELNSWRWLVWCSFLGSTCYWKTLEASLYLLMKSDTCLFPWRWNFGMFFGQLMRWSIGWPRKGCMISVVSFLHCSFLGFYLIVVQDTMLLYHCFFVCVLRPCSCVSSLLLFNKMSITNKKKSHMLTYYRFAFTCCKSQIYQLQWHLTTT